jgi:membrane associated rhomboid family serine protease
VFRVRVPAAFYLGAWFLLQLYEAHSAIVAPEEGGSGVAFAAHAGGFAFGAVAALALRGAGRIEPNVPVHRAAPV